MQLARRELLVVHEATPREPSVLIQLGKTCRALGQPDEAARCWTLALEYLSLAADKRANTVRAMLHNLGSNRGGIGGDFDDSDLIA